MSPRRLIRVGLLIVAASVLGSVVGWFALGADAEVPIHVGRHGVDRWVGRTEAVVSVPAAMVVVLAVGVVRARRTPAGTRALEPVVILVSLVLLALLHALVVTATLGDDRATAAVLGVGGAAGLVVLGAGRRRRRGAGDLTATTLISLGALLVVASPVLGVRGVLAAVIGGLLSIGLATSAVGRRTRREPPGGGE